MTFASHLTKSLEPMLASYSQSLLEKISEDYGLSYDELSQKYLSGAIPVPLPKVKAAAKKTSKVDMPQCSGHTAKGGQCQHKAFDDSGLCRIHQKKAEVSDTKAKESKEPKEKKKASKKVKKGPPPEHNHEVGAWADQCGLCESHGNPMNPELPSTEFESDGLADRLKALIMAEGEDEIPVAVPVEEETPVAEPIEEENPVAEPIEEENLVAEPTEEENPVAEPIDEETQDMDDLQIDEEVESDYEDEGEALTQALRNLMMQE